MKFCQKLSILMQLFYLNNTVLAKGIGVDASLVSRWKSGERKMTDNSTHLHRLSRYFVDLEKDSYQYSQLDNMINSLQRLYPDPNNDCRVHLLSQWLINDEVEIQYDQECSILDKSSVGIALFQDCRIIYANDSFANMIGFVNGDQLFNLSMNILVDNQKLISVKHALHGVDEGQTCSDHAV